MARVENDSQIDKKCSVPLIFLDVSFINRRVMLALFYSYLTEMLIFNGGSFYL
jgi:hypothetical protein